MAGGWLGVKSMPLSLQGLIIGKLASPTFKWAWPKRVQRALNVKASNQIQPSHQPSRGWVANGFVCKVGRVIFFLQVMGNFFFLHKKRTSCLSCYEAGFVLYLVRKFRVRLILHGITSRTLNHFFYVYNSNELCNKPHEYGCQLQYQWLHISITFVLNL